MNNIAHPLNFTLSHVFQDDGLGMIWGSQHSAWMEPNVNEQERAMGFHTHTIHLIGLLKVIRRCFLGQVMDLNYMTWFINPSLVEQ